MAISLTSMQANARPVILGKMGRLTGKTVENVPSLAAFPSFLQIQPPAILTRDNINPNPKMFFNNIYGNCTSAGLGNSLLAVTSLFGTTLDIPETCAVDFYSESTGFNPADPSTDQGGYEPLVLQYALTNGYPTKNYRFRPIWGSCPVGNRKVIANAINMLGVVYIGVTLYQEDEDAISNGQRWTVNPNGNMSVVGGHCVLIWGYTGLGDNDWVKIITWGGIVYATWAWIESRMDECHALAWHQLMPADTKNQLGQDWDTLVSLNKQYLNFH